MHRHRQHRSSRRPAVACALLAASFALGTRAHADTAPAAPSAAASPSSSTADGDWPMAARDYANTRFSPLGEITTTNAASLRLAFTFSTGVLRGHEAAPLVVGPTMFIVTPFPNIVYALDLSKPGAPLRWKFEPKPEPYAQGVACCDVVNRGLAFADGKLFLNTLDNQTLAVDAESGKELWRFRAGDIRAGETRTMAPLVVHGRVLIGNSGGEYGVRGWLIALDAQRGTELWRAYSTGPDRDVLIGPGYRPFYAKERGTDLGVKTWPSDAWKLGGGTVWGWISYDPELDLVYYGTATPGPWNAEQRPGDNKFTSGLFAREAATGQARWFYQMSPHDSFDYDGVNESVLLEIAWRGATRKVLVHPDRNGYVYVIDRATGEVLSATPFVPVNTSAGVDPASGQLRYAADKVQRTGTVVRDICPGSPGGKDWQPSAWSPRTGLLYIPHQNLCQDAETYEVSYIAGTPYVGVDIKMVPGPGGHRGEFTAWDPIARRAAWKVIEDLPVWSGTLATAGDVVFYGTMDGTFKALDAKSGALLWQFRTRSGIIGQPVSYRGPDGKQYIAVLSGVGGWAGAIVSGPIDARDSTAAAGFVNAMKDLPLQTKKGGTLYVFSLP